LLRKIERIEEKGGKLYGIDGNAEMGELKVGKTSRSIEESQRI